MPKLYDCVIIGGGIGGLTAAIYLARYKFRTCIIDNGGSRALLITKSNNYPGFPHGVSGPRLLNKLRKQYKRYQHQLITDTVIDIKKIKHGKLFAVRGTRTRIHSKIIILATGVIDIEPSIPNLTNAIKDGLIRHCLICDGYEARDKNIAIIAKGKKCLKTAFLWTQYSSKITFINMGKRFSLTPREKKYIAHKKINIILNTDIKAIVKRRIITHLIINNETYPFDIIYSALGTSVRSELAAKLGIKMDFENYILVNKHKETNIKGIYAIGDVTNDLKQMCVATSSAAIASTDIFNKLTYNH